MLGDIDRRPRFSFDISWEQQARANELLNLHGMRRAIMSLMLDDLLDLIEEHGHVVTGILLNRHAKPREIIPCLKEAADGGKAHGNY